MFCIVHYHNEGRTLAFKRKGIKVIEFKPNGNSPKWSEEYCKKITGETVKSEHSRDAIKLIFGR